MKFALVSYISEDIEKFSSLINSINLAAEDFFTQRNYGIDINELYVGLICISPQFEKFFKPRKAKYTEEKNYQKEGVTYSLYKIFEYDIKIDHSTLINCETDEARQFISQSIIQSLDSSEAIFSKLKFNLNDFKGDLIFFFKTLE